MIVVLGGVTGAGKTTIGRMVAEALQLPFLDADDFHAPESVEKMRRGEALTDVDREPWLDRLNAELRRRRGEGVVLACSALNDRYRRRLTAGLGAGEVRMVFLRVDPVELERRLAHRSGHFAAPGLLASQLATAEEPVDALVIDASAAVDVVVPRVLAALGTTAGGEGSVPAAGAPEGRRVSGGSVDAP